MKKLNAPGAVVAAVLIFIGLLLVLQAMQNGLLLSWLAPVFYLTTTLLLVVLHVLFALGIVKDALAESVAGRQIYFVSPEVWALATLIGGFFVVILYWVLHHSTLRRV